MTKLVKIVVLGFIALGFSACSGGMPNCTSSEVKNALESHRTIAQFKEMFGDVELSDFKSLGQDKEFENVMNCQCKITSKKSSESSGIIDFSAERLEDGGLALDAEISDSLMGAFGDLFEGFGQ